MKGPDVAGVDKGCHLEFPEQLRAVFHIQIQAYVTDLLGKGLDRISRHAAGTERTDRPAADAVRPAREIAALEGQHLRVAIRVTDAYTDVESQLVTVIQHDAFTEIHIAFHKLGIIDPEQFIAPLVVLSRTGQPGKPVQQITRHLERETDGMRVPQPVLRIIVCKRIGITRTDDELVGKIIPERGFRQIALERRVDFRQIHIIDVQQLEHVPCLHVAPLLPDVVPSGRENRPLELRPRLHVVANPQLGRRADLAAEILMHEGKQEARKQNGDLRPELPEVVSLRLAAGQRLVSASNFGGENLRAFEQVPVLIVQARSKTEVTCRVRPVQVDSEALQLGRRSQDRTIELHRVVLFDLRKADVHIAQSPQCGKRRIGLLHRPLVVETSGHDIIALAQDTRTDASAVLTVEDADAACPDRVVRHGARLLQRQRVVIGHDRNILDVIPAVHRVDHRPVGLLQAIGFQQHVQIHAIAVQRAVGDIRQVIPVEGIIAAPAEQGREALAFLVQHISVKQRAVLYQGGVIIGIGMESRSQHGARRRFEPGDTVDHRIVQIHRIVMDTVRDIGDDRIGDDSPFAPRSIDGGRDLGVHISFIEKEALQLVDRLRHQRRIQNNGRLSHPA